MIRINNKTDFTITWRLDNAGTPLPTFDYEVEFRTEGSRRYRVSSSGDKHFIPKPDSDGVVRSAIIVFDFSSTPHLPSGRLAFTLHATPGNALFEDGVMDIVEPQLTNIELWPGASDLTEAVECDFILPYVQGETSNPSGYPYPLYLEFGKGAADQLLLHVHGNIPDGAKIFLLRNVGYKNHGHDNRSTYGMRHPVHGNSISHETVNNIDSLTTEWDLKYNIFPIQCSDFIDQFIRKRNGKLSINQVQYADGLQTTININGRVKGFAFAAYKVQYPDKGERIVERISNIVKVDITATDADVVANKFRKYRVYQSL